MTQNQDSYATTRDQWIQEAAEEMSQQRGIPVEAAAVSLRSYWSHFADKRART